MADVRVKWLVRIAAVLVLIAFWTFVYCLAWSYL